jgi:hypothetical protein
MIEAGEIGGLATRHHGADAIVTTIAAGRRR